MAESSESYYEYEIERIQLRIEFTLGVIIPSIFALMLYSYILFPIFFQWLFVASLIVALLLIFPAKKLHNLHYRCWSRNTVPLRLVTGMIGTIYISVISIFSVSLLSIYEGLAPSEPTTVIILVTMLALLIALIAYHSKNKERFLSMEKRFFQIHPIRIEEIILEFLERSGERFTRYPEKKGLNVSIKNQGLTIRVHPLWNNTSEVIIENIDTKNLDTVIAVKSLLKTKI
ncbi:MAG: hypothetical protein NO474_03170 [Methanomassiliicoccales archaeon]|jgi:hypothetical protein|nr:hypothetical protein [Methanomassiliicoccales archaeon]